VQAAAPSQGGVEVDARGQVGACRLVRFEGPGRAVLGISVKPSCTTQGDVYVHVFHGTTHLSAARHRDPLPFERFTSLDTGAFDKPDAGAELSVEVFSHCAEARLHGVAGCRL